MGLLTQNRLRVSLQIFMASRLFFYSSSAYTSTPGSSGFQRGFWRRWNNNQIAMRRTLSSITMMRESVPRSEGQGEVDDANYTSTRWDDDDDDLIDPVLKRPKFFFNGGRYRHGSHVLLHHLVNDMLLNAVDKAQARFFPTVDVVLARDGSFVSVTDNRRRPRTDMISPATDLISPVTKESAMEVFRAGGLTHDDTYIVPGGLYGVGLSVVNALSQALEVTSRDRVVEYQLKFTSGKPTTPKPVVSIVREPGQLHHEPYWTRITFWPDKEMFTSETHFDYGTISRRIKELAFLNPGLTITIRKEDTDPEKKSQYLEYFYPGGLKDYVRYLNSNRKPLHNDILGFSKQVNGCAIDIAFQWCEDPASDAIFLGYVNGISCPEGGSHIEGAKIAISDIISHFIQEIQQNKNEKFDYYYRRYDHTKAGFTCVISVKVPDPAFEGLTLTRMVSCEVFTVVKKYVSEYLADYIMLHPNVIDAIHAKCQNVKRADLAARSAATAARSAAIPARRSAITTRTVLKGFFCQEKNIK